MHAQHRAGHVPAHRAPQGEVGGRGDRLGEFQARLVGKLLQTGRVTNKASKLGAYPDPTSH